MSAGPAGPKPTGSGAEAGAERSGPAAPERGQAGAGEGSRLVDATEVCGCRNAAVPGPPSPAGMQASGWPGISAELRSTTESLCSASQLPLSAVKCCSELCIP